MEKVRLIERAKMYLQLLNNGVHPVTMEEMPSNSVFMDEKVKSCFTFIMQILGEHIELLGKVEELEVIKEEKTVVVAQKEKFAITQEQCDNIKLSQKPVTILSFMNNINSAINTEVMEKLTSTRVNKWFTQRGLISSKKVETVVQKTVYQPTDLATKIGIVEEEVVDKKTGEVKVRIKLSARAQLFVVENLQEIIENT